MSGPTAVATNVAEPCSEYISLADEWQLIADLLGGTRAMVESAEIERYLPPFPAEKSRDDLEPGELSNYELRVREAVLFEVFADAVRACVSKFFAKPIELIDLPQELEIFEFDADGEGTPITEFARQFATTAVAYGKASIYTSATTLRPGQIATREDARSGRVRPFFVQVRPLDLIGFVFMDRNAGRPSAGNPYRQIRLKEMHHETVGLFGSKCTSQIRVVDASSGRAVSTLYRSSEEGAGHVLVPDSEVALPFDGIPLETVYTNRIGREMAESPLRGLAYLNLQHFREYSDHIQAGHLLRMGNKFFRRGFSEEELDVPFRLDPRQTIDAFDEKASLQAVEWSGNGFVRSGEALRDLEKRMEVMAARPQMERTGSVTATSTSLHYSEAENDARAFIEVIEAGLQRAFAHAAVYRGIELPESFRVKINRDAIAARRSSDNVKALTEARRNRDISREDYLVELKNQGILHEDSDPEVLAERAGRASTLEGSGLFGEDE